MKPTMLLTRFVECTYFWQYNSLNSIFIQFKAICVGLISTCSSICRTFLAIQEFDEGAFRFRCVGCEPVWDGNSSSRSSLLPKLDVIRIFPFSNSSSLDQLSLILLSS